MGEDAEPGGDTAGQPDETHDWTRDVDVQHLDLIRREPAAYAPSGALHLVLEVLAYAADEAECNGAGKAVVTAHPDGSVSVADDGRGTETRADDVGGTVRKPVIGTKDLRFFDSPGMTVLPDGHPRRGMSVVTALSEWLVHTSRRRTGAWTQRYERGIPVTGLTPVPGDDTTGTTVRFLPEAALVPVAQIPLDDLDRLARAFGPCLTVEITQA